MTRILSADDGAGGEGAGTLEGGNPGASTTGVVGLPAGGMAGL